MVSCPCSSLHLFHSSLSLQTSILCFGTYVCQTWLPVLYHFPSQAPNTEWQWSPGPSFRFWGNSSVSPALTSYPFQVQASVTTWPEICSDGAIRADAQGWSRGGDTSRFSQVSGEEEIVSILDSLGVETANLHTPCSLEVMSILWPIPINLADLFLSFIWSRNHSLTSSLCFSSLHFLSPVS